MTEKELRQEKKAKLKEALAIAEELYDKIIKEKDWDFLFKELGENSERNVDRFMNHLREAKGEGFATNFFKNLIWLVCAEKIEYEKDLRERKSNLAEISFQALFLTYEVPKELKKRELKDQSISR